MLNYPNAGTALVNCGTGASILDLAAITFVCWAYPRTCGQRLQSRLVLKGAVAGQGWQFYMGGPDVDIGLLELIADIEFGGNNCNHTTAANSFTLNAWHHFAFTYDGGTLGSGIHIYIDGTEATYSAVQDGTGSRASDATGTLYLGSNDAGNRSMDGKLVGPAIWSSVLTAAQISLLAGSRLIRMPHQVSPSSLVSFFPMDEFVDGATASGASTIRDRVGTNHGTPSNSPTGAALEYLSY
jgi:hypothetical protein